MNVRMTGIVWLALWATVYLADTRAATPAIAQNNAPKVPPPGAVEVKPDAKSPEPFGSSAASPLGIPDFEKLAPGPLGAKPNTSALEEEERGANNPPPSANFRRLVPPEPILSISSPMQVSRSRTQYFFVGRTERETVLFLYQWRSNHFFDIAPVRDGYRVMPLSYVPSLKTLSFEVGPSQGRLDWSTMISRPRPRAGENVYLALFPVTEQLWKFLKLPLLLPVEEVLWLAHPDKPEHYVSSMSDNKTRFIAPLQAGDASRDIFETFSFQYDGNSFLVWVDYCQNRKSEHHCMWMSELPKANRAVTLPTLFARLPVRTDSHTKWSLDSSGSYMVLTRWREGAPGPTRRWWKSVTMNTWHPFYQSPLVDPLAHTVVVADSESRVSFYFLKNANGATARLQRAAINLKTGKATFQEAKKDVPTPYRADLFPITSQQILMVSDTALFEVELANAFESK